MRLDDQIWSALEGGYRDPYNAYVVLSELELAVDPKVMGRLLGELWDNLHHQGDVGVASYMSIPSLVDICITKKSLDWNFIGLCVVIEHCRRSEGNPVLPVHYESYYLMALSRFQNYLLDNFQSLKEPVALRLTLAFLATMNGQFNLGKAIEHLDDDVLEEFLNTQ